MQRSAKRTIVAPIHGAGARCAGQYRVVATTFSPGERGPYQLSLTMLTASAQAAMADRSADKIQESPLVRRDSRTSTGKR